MNTFIGSSADILNYNLNNNISLLLNSIEKNITIFNSISCIDLKGPKRYFP